MMHTASRLDLEATPAYYIAQGGLVLPGYPLDRIPDFPRLARSSGYDGTLLKYINHDGSSLYGSTIDSLHPSRVGTWAPRPKNPNAGYYVGLNAWDWWKADARLYEIEACIDPAIEVQIHIQTVGTMQGFTLSPTATIAQLVLPSIRLVCERADLIPAQCHLIAQVWRAFPAMQARRPVQRFSAARESQIARQIAVLQEHAANPHMARVLDIRTATHLQLFTHKGMTESERAFVHQARITAALLAMHGMEFTSGKGSEYRALYKVVCDHWEAVGGVIQE